MLIVFKKILKTIKNSRLFITVNKDVLITTWNLNDRIFSTNFSFFC